MNVGGGVRVKNSIGLVLGLAAVAVGVVVGVGFGVSAALYYFFKKSLTDSEQKKASHEQSRTLEECPICFEEMLKSRDIWQLMCGHKFHVACVGSWLEKHNTCPYCRKNIEH